MGLERTPSRLQHHMTEALLTGTAFGLVAGLVPGPFLAFVAATAMEKGLGAGLRAALAPLAVETPVLLAAAFFLARLPGQALQWVGVVGGVAIAGLGVYVFRRARQTRTAGRDTGEGGGTRNFLGLVGAGLLSPAPWVFWTVIGGPLVLRNWRQGPPQAAAFVGTFLASFVGAQMLVAFGASRGVRIVDERWRRRVMRGLSLVLVAAGGVLAWQAWTGNFRELIEAQQTVETMVP